MDNKTDSKVNSKVNITSTALAFYLRQANRNFCLESKICPFDKTIANYYVWNIDADKKGSIMDMLIKELPDAKNIIYNVWEDDRLVLKADYKEALEKLNIFPIVTDAMITTYLASEERKAEIHHTSSYDWNPAVMTINWTCILKTDQYYRVTEEEQDFICHVKKYLMKHFPKQNDINETVTFYRHVLSLTFREYDNINKLKEFLQTTKILHESVKTVIHEPPPSYRG